MLLKSSALVPPWDELATSIVRRVPGVVGVDLQIDDQTSFVKNDRTDSRRSLLDGTRVVVDVDTIQRGVYRARLVRIFGGGRPQ